MERRRLKREMALDMTAHKCHEETLPGLGIIPPVVYRAEKSKVWWPDKHDLHVRLSLHRIRISNFHFVQRVTEQIFSRVVRRPTSYKPEKDTGFITKELYLFKLNKNSPCVLGERWSFRAQAQGTFRCKKERKKLCYSEISYKTLRWRRKQQYNSATLEINVFNPLILKRALLWIVIHVPDAI